MAHVRESLSLGSLGPAIAGSAPVRELALGLLMTGLGSGRISRLARLVGRLVVVARLALAAFTAARTASHPSGASPPPS
jgi:hypothetical protein